MSKSDSQVSRREFGALTSGLLITTALGAAGCGTTRAAMAGASESDPFQMLSQDHRQVDQMLQRAAAAPDPRERTKLFEQVRLALTQHAVAEENALYPVAYQQAALRPATPELFEDHSQMKVVLYELEQMPKEGGPWRDGVMSLRQMVLDHAREEETEVFPQLRSALGPEQIQRLAQMLRRERSLVG